MPTPTDCRRCGRPYYGAAGLLCDECEREAKRPLDAADCSLSSECRGPTHYAGCACHEKGWENKWKCAVEMAARAGVERDMWKANHDNQVAIKRIIAARPDLKDRAPKVEKLMAERNRAQAWSIRQHERIKRLEAVIRTLDPAHETLPENV